MLAAILVTFLVSINVFAGSTVDVSQPYVYPTPKYSVDITGDAAESLYVNLSFPIVFSSPDATIKVSANLVCFKNLKDNGLISCRIPISKEAQALNPADVWIGVPTRSN